MLRQKLSSLIVCPTDWDAICSNDTVCYWMRFAWYLTIRNNQVDREASLIGYDHCGLNVLHFDLLDEQEVSSTVHNIERWHAAAITDYKNKTRRLEQLRVLASEDYDKHYTAGQLTDAEVALLSQRRGEGVLFPRVSEVEQMQLSWEVLGKHLEVELSEETCMEHYFAPAFASGVLSTLIFNPHTLVLGAKLSQTVGCTRGQPSEFAAFKFDFSTPTVHVHPINEAEFQTTTLKVVLA